MSSLSRLRGRSLTYLSSSRGGKVEVQHPVALRKAHRMLVEV